MAEHTLRLAHRDGVPFMAPSSHHSQTLRSDQDRRRALVPTLCIPKTDVEGGPSRLNSTSRSYSSSRPYAASPSPPPFDSPAGCEVAQWELVPYDVPWGSEYYRYKAGTLPGPEGKCLFLRSPTPVEKRRAPQACRMCRERKAKCSGTHPTCQRCLSRGLICEYAPESRRRTKAPSQQPRNRSNRALVHPYSRRSSDTFSVGSNTDSSDYASSYSHSPKREEVDFVISDSFHYPCSNVSSSPDSRDWTPESSQSPHVVSQECSPYISEQPHSAPPITPSFWNVEQTASYEPLGPAFHAPRPLRYTQSMPFLPSGDQTTLSANLGASLASTEGPSAITVDSRSFSEPAIYYFDESSAESTPAPLDFLSHHVEPSDYLQYPADHDTLLDLTCCVDFFAPPEAYIANQVHVPSRDSIAYQCLSTATSLA
ncbi:hypothetical protein NLI96_g898 [Meripilus lineatus]|uniref:Zn(2)-C6 fungal-type domain-containing protein n=1 Tax=Meripilus lineatus TaxID=2056292 RepID=A0AAD5VBU8_9APHY|nr:hypothetical protein NLI96_g898 [Physisporinus lineatus]